MTGEIKTYKEFLEHSPIKQIIITNKERQEGYLRFENHTWNRIWDKDSTDDNAEILYLWLKHNSQDSYYYQFNYDKIIQDICRKCFCKKPYIYQLKYHEFIIKCHGNAEYLLNTKSLNISKFTEDIILNDGASERIMHLSNDTYIDTLNTNIVTRILQSLINNNNIINQFQHICYNILVESKEIIIFYDNSPTFHFLSSWLSDLIFSICANDHPCGYKCDFDENEKASYKKLFKNNKPRVVFMNNIYDDIELQNHINFLKDLGIKNIVVKTKSDSNQYDYKRFIEYLAKNKDKIASLFPVKLDSIKYYPDINQMEKEFELGNYDDIFYRTDMLFNNFLIWCCIPKNI